MVNICCIKGCSTKAGQGIMLHKIPTGELGVKWVEFIKLYNQWFKLSKWAVVCGNHFTENDYGISFTSIKGRKTLHDNSVPSIFNNSFTHAFSYHAVCLVLLNNYYLLPIEVVPCIDSNMHMSVAKKSLTEHDESLSTSTPSAYFAVSPNSYECTESKKIN